MSVNYDASELTQRRQNKTLYANYIVQQENVAGGCKLAVGLQNGHVADANIVPNLSNGALDTSLAERALILANGACPLGPTVIPNYVFSCFSGLQILTPNPSGTFTFTTTSLGTGTLVLYFKNMVNDTIGTVFIVLGVDPQTVTPISGTASIQYYFLCVPIVLQPSCSGSQDPSSGVLEVYYPYSFYNATGTDFDLTLTPSVGSPIIQTVTNGSTFTPNPNYGWIYYSIPCSLATIESDSFSAYNNLGGMTFTGALDALGGSSVTEIGVVWNTDSNVAPNVLTDNVVPFGGSIYNGVVYTVTYTYSDLSVLTNYARAYAINSSGTAYGDIFSATPIL
jgi:hypothetical protein